MKVALVNNRFSLIQGGLERFSVNLCKKLLEKGHEVHLFGQGFDDVPEGAVTHRIQVPSKPSFLRVWAFSRRVQQQLRGESFDVVYGLAKTYPVDLYRLGDGIQRHWLKVKSPGWFARVAGVALNPTHLVNLFLEKQVFNERHCRRWITNSRLCKEHAESYMGVSPDHVHVVYNGVDQGLFNTGSARLERERLRAELGLGPDDLLAIYVSNNWKRKGLDVLLRAMARLGGEGRSLHLLVVGRGKQKPFIPLLQSLELDERVHFMPPTREINLLYGSSDLLVLPTLYDPFANVCLEAMACGLPVITTRSNGASELIVPGENGYIQADARDAAELGGLLRECLDADRLRAMSIRAAEVAREFTPEKNLTETLHVFGLLENEPSEEK